MILNTAPSFMGVYNNMEQMKTDEAIYSLSTHTLVFQFSKSILSLGDW